MNKKTLAVAILFLGLVAKADAQSLKGSPESIGYQYLYAEAHDIPFLPNAEAVRFFAAGGMLVELADNDDYELFKVSFPFVLPTTRHFVEWFAREYRLTCGEKLVLTSATRPIDRQPANAHPYSVHPTGMSVDMRLPTNRACRRFLEETMLAFEARSVVDVTLETNPWHYHVTVFSFIEGEESLLATR